jgi:hypothetical protein
MASIEGGRRTPTASELIEAMREATYFGEAEVARRVLATMIRVADQNRVGWDAR